LEDFSSKEEKFEQWRYNPNRTFSVYLKIFRIILDIKMLV